MIDTAHEQSGAGTVAGGDALAAVPAPSPIPMQVHTVTFMAMDVGQAVETLLGAIGGRVLTQWPEQVILAPGPGFTLSAQRVVRVESQYSIADGQTVYALSVLTVAGGGQAS